MSNQNENQSNQPAAKLRDGNIKIAIFRNESEKGTFFSGRVCRTYKDADGNYVDTSSFSGTEWLRVAELARLAYHSERALKQTARTDEHAKEAEHEHHGVVASNEQA